MSSFKKRKLAHSLNSGPVSSESTSKDHEQALDIESESTRNDYFPLANLPNELILLIFDYLTADELVCISSLGNKRLADLTYGIKCVDFSSSGCSDMGKLYSYVSKRREVIRQLNFSFVKHITSAVIFNIAKRCKHLTELHIIKCNIDYLQLRKIFENCSSISTLSWDFDCCSDYTFCKPFPSVKFLNLLVVDQDTYNLSSIVSNLCMVFMTSFFVVEVSWIYFTCEPVTSLPFIEPWTKVSCFSNSKANKTRMIVCSPFCSFLFFLYGLPSKPVCPFENSWHGFSRNDTFFCSSFAQLKSDCASISLLSSCSSTMFSSLTILLTPEILLVSEKLTELVNRVAGVKLKYLILQKSVDSVSVVPSNEPAESLAICDVLEKIVAVSLYITVLNIFSVHFEKASFESIKVLKFLKTLFIPSCAFPESHSEEETVSNPSAVQFEDVVKACPLVEDFILIFCNSCSGLLLDKSLLPLQEWKELKKLKMYSISLRSCNFLRKISVSCQKLERLSLISFSFNTASYVPDLIYFLQNAKSMKLLQINDRSFNPMYERFWELLSDCSTLQGICIYSDFSGYVHKQRILKAVKKLNRLQLFHFCIAGVSGTQRISSDLYSNVKKCMLKNGVKNCFIHQSVPKYSPTYKLSLETKYHQVPVICGHLHVV